ncbi:MAG TPA: aminoglycoside adenylyltransferase domain-containing protein [Nocardioidaceae bacterium]|nr:aminoglycoside adenylyltransferase domain-containing protein [Nocardioidaceae bacterium]
MRYVPGPVQQVTGLFLALVDEARPGLVEGLYLHGSLGFGEWYDGRSDIDYVAVLGERPDTATVNCLREIHDEVATTFQRPPFDGFHLTWEDLMRPPSHCPDLPCTQAGLFHEAERLDVHPVTWHELARHGVTVRGPELSDVEIWTDAAELRRYTRDNLATYWRGQADALAQFPAEAGKPDIVAWCVLGVSRLHHLLATGELTSKTGAGRYAVEAFGERWRLLVTEALAVRLSGETSGAYDEDAEARAKDCIAFTDMVVREGLCLPS